MTNMKCNIHRLYALNFVLNLKDQNPENHFFLEMMVWDSFEKIKKNFRNLKEFKTMINDPEFDYRFRVAAHNGLRDKFYSTLVQDLKTLVNNIIQSSDHLKLINFRINTI